jgi:2-oxoglutarate dehydrogenase E2 component (dihydrolipoamide succinyltransferase)/2-oxoisovalerate dehydrogenase E2 component (dihydrolipoyl transacylase)
MEALRYQPDALLRRDGVVRFGLWLVEPGESFYAGDSVAEVLLEGAVLDVPAPAAGKLIERVAWPGDVLAPGQVLGTFSPDPDA